MALALMTLSTAALADTRIVSSGQHVFRIHDNALGVSPIEDASRLALDDNWHMNFDLSVRKSEEKGAQPYSVDQSIPVESQSPAVFLGVKLGYTF